MLVSIEGAEDYVQGDCNTGGKQMTRGNKEREKMNTLKSRIKNIKGGIITMRESHSIH